MRGAAWKLSGAFAVISQEYYEAQRLALTACAAHTSGNRQQSSLLEFRNAGTAVRTALQSLLKIVDRCSAPRLGQRLIDLPFTDTKAAANDLPPFNKILRQRDGRLQQLSSQRLDGLRIFKECAQPALGSDIASQ